MQDDIVARSLYHAGGFFMTSIHHLCRLMFFVIWAIQGYLVLNVHYTTPQKGNNHHSVAHTPNRTLFPITSPRPSLYHWCPYQNCGSMPQCPTWLHRSPEPSPSRHGVVSKWKIKSCMCSGTKFKIIWIVSLRGLFFEVLLEEIFGNSYAQSPTLIWLCSFSSSFLLWTSQHNAQAFDDGI